MATFSINSIRGGNSRPAQGVEMKQADKDYFLTKDDKLTDDAEEAATLLVRKGQDITQQMARYFDKKKAASEEAEEEATGEKASSPAANKATSPAKNKGAKQ